MVVSTNCGAWRDSVLAAELVLAILAPEVLAGVSDSLLQAASAAMQSAQAVLTKLFPGILFTLCPYSLFVLSETKRQPMGCLSKKIGLRIRYPF
jgi:hypothetical protein